MTRAVIAAVVMFVATRTAAADGFRLSVAGGAGGAGTQPCSYLERGSICGETSLSVSGVAPLVLAGYRATYGKGTWKLRLGGVASLLYVLGTDGKSSTATGAGEIGVENNGYGLDVIMGISKIRVEDHGMTDSGYTTMMGFAFSGRINQTMSWFVRLEGHVAMHAVIGAGFMGAGVEWRPGR